VIGSGFGGLAAAARLRKKGYDVTLLEAGAQAGGRARVFERDGFTFDAGPTVVTAPYLFDELFDAFGRRREDYVKFQPVDPFYRCSFDDGAHFDYVGDEERLLAQIEQLAPQDVDGYRKMVAHAERIFDVGYTQLADAPFGNLSDMLRVVPDLGRLSAYRSVHSLVAKYIQDPRLRQVFTFEPLLIGGNPMKAPGIYLLIHYLERKWGVHYAQGGTGAIVRSLVQLLHEVGVEVQMNAPVDRIETKDGRVRGVVLEDGRVIDADLVVSNADPTLVYSKMLDPAILSKNTPRKVLRKRQSMSLFVGYFGTSKQYADTKHHTIVLGSRYEGLLKDIFERRVLADDFSLYLHRPGASDPGMAPAGKDAFYVLSPVPNQLSGIDWAARSEAYFDAILEELERRELPGLHNSLETKFSVDPRYFEGPLRSHQGAAFGLEPILTQSAYFRYHNACPDVAGLYFVGASTHPGAGMPGVLCSAKVLERVVPEPKRGGQVVNAPLRLVSSGANATQGAA
jgi:phytoene desaturase